MPGKRPRNPRVGSVAERLAEFVLSGFAFTTPVPWQDDVGHDLHCVLMRRPKSGQSILAGPSFMVQVKSRKQTLHYKEPEEITWISRQENPFFVCFANPRQSQVDLYSTCALVPGILHHGRHETVLEPDVLMERQNIYKDDDGVLHIPLGPPVLSLRMEDVQDDKDLARWAAVLEPWIELDRQNIVNRRARIHWVHWPVGHQTNEVLGPESRLQVGFYWNVQNLETTRTNFLRAATLFRLELAQLAAQPTDEEFVTAEQVAALNQAIEAFWTDLGPTARQNIRTSADDRGWPLLPNP